MKFAFIENRYKTIFWAALAVELRALGHDTVLLVQNPVFAPADENVKVMPFPAKSDFSVGVSDDAFLRVRRADRFVNYFQGNDGHYKYYSDAIEAWLDSDAPDIVVGESTLFHELLVIDACKRREIPYFHPSMPGYPGGRYSVYQYDSKHPFDGWDDIPGASELLAIAEAIRKRERVPDYMVAPAKSEPERLYPLPRSLKDRLTILRGYLIGERYNTPSPIRKWWLDVRTRNLLKSWQAISVEKSRCVPTEKVVLYPLQMQPEANLDVWGQAYRDQAKLVAEMAESLPAGWQLWVKANPKAKYEICPKMIEVIREHPKVFPISLGVGMADVLNQVDLVCTVTGTVAVECVLSGKPLGQLGPSIVPNGLGCIYMTSAREIEQVAVQVAEGKFPHATESDKAELVKRLYSTTFPGKISDPLSLPAVMGANNISSVAGVLVKLAEGVI